MKSLTGSNEWPAIAVFDIEATEWVNVVLLCHVDESGRRRCFRTMSAYIDWLLRTEIEYTWSHWGGKYDNRFVIAELMRRDVEFEVIMSGSAAIIVKAHFGSDRTIQFCDSARIMPASVAQIGKTIGLPKLDVDRSNIGALTFEETATYCYRDCDIVVKGLQEMKRALTEVGADFAFTLASIATRWVRRSECLDWSRFEDKANKKEMKVADAFCEPAYFGGRTEVFRVGDFKQTLFYYDVRSSYPWSMTYDLPAYPMGEVKKVSEQNLNDFGVTEATVTVPVGTYLPVLPVYDGGKLLFPVGKFRGRWTNLELIQAINAGASLKIHAQYLFEPVAFMKPFVETFFGLRQEAISDGDAFKSFAYKILTNSAYGKLIESVERIRLIHGEQRVAESLKRGDSIEPTNMLGLYQSTSQQEGAFRHVAAGAYVTARSRLLLWDRMNKIVKSGGKIFYCDTDSIVTDTELKEEPDELGNLKLEHVLTEFEAFAPKVYRMVTDDGQTYYKVKGTPVEKGDDGEKLSQEKAFKRWQDYTTGIPVGRLGLSGLLTDINRGRIAPQAEMLSRALRNTDSKRMHQRGDSRPRVMQS